MNPLDGTEQYIQTLNVTEDPPQVGMSDLSDQLPSKAVRPQILTWQIFIHSKIILRGTCSIPYL